MTRTLLVLLVLATAAPPALADDGDEVARKKAAAAEYEAGAKQFKAERYDAAAARFKKAWDTYPDPAYLFNIGVAFEMQKRWRLAVEHYRLFLKRFPDSPAGGDVERRLQAALEQVRATSVEVTLETSPPDAEARIVSRGGEETCQTPCAVWVSPGPVSVELTREGQTRRLTREVALGKPWTASVDFAAPPDSLPPQGSGEAPDTTLRTAGWAVLGTSGAVLIGSAILGGITWATYQDADELARTGNPAQDEARLEGMKEDVRTTGLAADAMLGVGLAGAVVGVILVVVGDEPAPATDGDVQGPTTSWRVRF